MEGKVFDGVKMTKKPLSSFPREMNSNSGGISDNVKRGKKRNGEISKSVLISKNFFFLKQRVDSYNFRPEIYLLFSTGQKLTNLFSTGSFSNLEKIFFSPKYFFISKGNKNLEFTQILSTASFETGDNPYLPFFLT